VLYACNIYLHQAWTNAIDKMTAKDYMFYKTLCIHRKILKYKLCRVLIPAKRCWISIVEVQDLLLEVVDLK